MWTSTVKYDANSCVPFRTEPFEKLDFREAQNVEIELALDVTDVAKHHRVRLSLQNVREHFLLTIPPPVPSPPPIITAITIAIRHPTPRASNERYPNDTSMEKKRR